MPTHSTAASPPSWTTWPRSEKLALLAQARQRLWRQQARPEQLPPDGDWRTWYLRGGRGAGKTRTGSETLAGWIWNSEPGEWAIVAPTYGDAKNVCVEGASGIIKALGGEGGGVERWNRSEGIIHVANGSKIFLDGGDDGALRIQGRNLRGLWADEVGLWVQWDRAWNESIAYAVRLAPARIVATGTPKVGHPLIGQLLNAPVGVVHTHMRTVDNADNLDAAAVAALVEQYGGSTLGRQELEGEYIDALEGTILSRLDWRWYPVELSFYGREFGPLEAGRLPHFDQIIHSWDTAFKAKTSNDYVAGQVWGVKGADRHLLRLWHAHAGLAQTVVAMRELRDWALELWPRIPHRILIENTANGPEAIAEMRKHVDGVHPVNVTGQDKAQRAFTAAPALETGHCYLPGEPDAERVRGYNSRTPAEVQSFVEECAMFRGDLKHAHDDQVDAWSQMVNWVRRRSASGSTSVPSGRVLVGAR